MISPFRPERLRAGELIAGAGALALLGSMLLLEWFGSSAPRTAASNSVNGWHGLTHLRWLILLTIVAVIVLVALQGVRPAPALPAVMSLIVSVLGVLTVVALLYRVVIDVPGAHLHQRLGAFLGLLSSLILAYGGYASLRQEGIASRDGPSEIELIALDPEGWARRP
ncbi:MAG: hypothetical protein ACR2OB_03225 [Solirubrobacteraceae bacterium]